MWNHYAYNQMHKMVNWFFKFFMNVSLDGTIKLTCQINLKKFGPNLIT